MLFRSTLITGELREEHFNEAHEQGWNLYPCGHYATSPIMERWVRNKDASRVNNLLGRRFKITSVRWLRDSDI